MTVFVLHVLAIAHGIGAGLAWFLLFHAAGLALLPRRTRASIAVGGTPAVLGGSAYVLACWFGVQAGIRLAPLAFSFAAVALGLVIVRRRAVFSVLRAQLASRVGGAWMALFAGFYLLGYVFVLPPASSNHLPVAWLGNTDLLQYLVYARHLLYLGPSPVSDVSTHSYVYFQTPGAFFLLDGMAIPFGIDPMRAAMPAIFAPAALTGVVAAYVSRRLFGLSFAVAASAAAMMISGPFFRFIVGHYYLATLLAMPVFLNALLLAATFEGRDGRAWLELSVAFFCHSVLLLFIYPYLFLIALVFEAAAFALAAFSSWQVGERFLARSVVSAGAALTAVAGLGALVPKHLAWVAEMLRLLSQTGRWGWALDVISPFAMLGFPAAVNRAQAAGTGPHTVYLAVLWLLGAGLFLVSLFPRACQGAGRGARVFLGLAGLGFLTYAGYFALVGASYQQWKLASYTVLPLSFVPAAALLAATAGLGARLAAHGRRWRFLAGAAVSAICVSAVAGNALVHAASDPALRRLPGHLRNIAQLNALPFRDVSIEVSDVTDAFLVAYMVPGKRLHVSMPSFIPNEPVAFEDISPARPLLMLNYSCEGIGHRDVRSLGDAGCLVLQPPSLAADTGYRFGRTYLFIEPIGLGPREDWGRWNRRTTVELRLAADPRRIRLDSDAWLNLFLQPYLVPSLQGQRIRLNWGNGRRAEVLLGERGWISLPLRGSDWAGDWVCRQTVSLELPDAVPPHWVDGRYLETRSLAVGFLELSVSASPRGRTVTPLQ